MIQKLIILKNQDVYEIIEPITGIFIGESIFHSFACDFAAGFIFGINNLTKSDTLVKPIAWYIGAQLGIKILLKYQLPLPKG